MIILGMFGEKCPRCRTRYYGTVPNDFFDDAGVCGSCRRARPTAEEFEAAYAALSGVTVEQLHLWGRFAEPCVCKDALCEGWAMGYPWEEAIVEELMRSGAA